MTLSPAILRRLSLCLGAGSAVLATLVAAAPIAAHHLLINETPSVPVGLYIRRPDISPGIGELVAVAQPVAARPYLKSRKVPGDMVLLKRIAATRGDWVCRRNEVMQIGARLVPALARDRHGAPLPVWRGCRILGADEFLVLGDTATSFDGRYFGPVGRHELRGVYRAVLLW